MVLGIPDMGIKSTVTGMVGALSWSTGEEPLGSKTGRAPLYTVPANTSTEAAAVMPNLKVESAPPGPWKLNYTCYYKLADTRKCAILVDDIQEEYRKFYPDGFLPAAVKTVNAARAAGIPIIYSHYSREKDSDGYYGALDEWYGPYGHCMDAPAGKTNPMYLSGADGNKIAPEVAPAAGDPIIPSKVLDCFANYDANGKSILKEILKAKGINTLVLVGAWTDDCILSTAVRAVNENFNAVIVEDAVFTCTSVKDEALAVMRHAYALMTTADEISDYWAKNPQAP
jgi:nicotinamidase-related amidase